MLNRNILILMLSLTLLLTGCFRSAPGKEAPYDTTGKAPAQTTLRVLYTTVEAGSEAVIDAARMYELETGIQIEISTFPYTSLKEKVFSELAQRSSHFDLIAVDTPWMPKIIKHLEPMSEWIQHSDRAERIRLDDFIAKLFLDTSVYRKEQPHLDPPSMEMIDLQQILSEGFDVWSLPIQSNALTVSYRKDLFETPRYQALYKAEYGKVLTVPETLEDYLNIARFFTRDTNGDGTVDLYGTTLMGKKHESNFVDFKSFLSVYGGQIFDEHLHPVFNNEAGVRALETYGSWIEHDQITPPDVLNYSWDEVSIAFGFGQVAMGMNYHGMRLNPKVEGGEVGYFMFPGKMIGDELVRGPHFGSWGIAINKYSKQKQAAYELAEYLTSPDVQQGYLRFKQHVTRNSAYEAAQDLTDSSAREYYQVLRESLRVGVGRPRISNYDQVSETVQQAIQRYLAGKTDARTALDEAAETVERMMEQAGYRE